MQQTIWHGVFLALNEVQAARVASLGQPVFQVHIQPFADGEVSYRLPPELPKDKRVAVVGQLPEDLLAVARVAHLLQAAGYADVWACSLYLGWTRADAETQPPLATLSILLHGLVRGLITVSPHSTKGWALPLLAVDGFTLLAEALVTELPKPLIVVAPDNGAKAAAQRVAEKLGATFGSYNKARMKANQVEAVTWQNGELAGQHVLIVDDLIDTAQTLRHVAADCHARGALSVRAAAVHGVFSAAAPENLAAAKLAALWVLNTRAPLTAIPQLQMLPLKS